MELTLLLYNRGACIFYLKQKCIQVVGVSIIWSYLKLHCS